MAIKVMPKGLRAFDSGDTDFFISLLPGPHDREGLPESIQFWRNRIHDLDSEKTFTVGLVYGPSGCGKTSLMKAGLLPTLNSSIQAVYLEATASETERMLEVALVRKLQIPKPTDGQPRSLTEIARNVRHGQYLPPGQKLLVVIDQFEQWLFANEQSKESDLIDFLRQCDGTRFQAIVMVRDDFWMAASRFFRELDIPLLERFNSMAVDLFAQDHAKRVLWAFGNAYGKVSLKDDNQKRDLKQFIEEVIGGLAENGKVNSVRISLFAEMMKHHPWTLKSLKQVGGTSGVGVNFLEETFAGTTAPIRHRQHQAAARRILGSLLPDAGTNIKGSMRSTAELQNLSGYAQRPTDFAEVLQLLDNDLRLITPVDTSGLSNLESDDQPTDNNPPRKVLNEDGWSPDRRYQLTHDYLVPAIRVWLNRKQQQSRSGRAEIKLAERTANWIVNRENKQLPSFWEWLSILWWGDPTGRTESQTLMLNVARRVHVRQIVTIAAVFFFVMCAAGLVWRNISSEYKRVLAETRAEQRVVQCRGLVEGLLRADAMQLSASLKNLEGFRDIVPEPLSKAFAEHDESSVEKLHAALGLVNFHEKPNEAPIEFLKNRLSSVMPRQFDAVFRSLQPNHGHFAEHLQRITRDRTAPMEQRLASLAALATWESNGPATSMLWSESELLADLCKQLVSVQPTEVAFYQNIFKPVAQHLKKPLLETYRQSPVGSIQRSIALDLLIDYATSDVDLLSELVLSDIGSLRVMLPTLMQHKKPLMDAMERILQQPYPAAKLPVPSSLADLDDAAKEEIEKSSGWVSNESACCVRLPWDSLQAVLQSGREAGYRPVRIRPWLDDQKVRVAVVWVRDGRDWEMQIYDRDGLPDLASDVYRGEQVPVDFVMLPQQFFKTPQWIILWGGRTDNDLRYRLITGADRAKFMSLSEELVQDGFLSQCTVHTVTNSDQAIYSAIYSTERPTSFNNVDSVKDVVSDITLHDLCYGLDSELSELPLKENARVALLQKKLESEQAKVDNGNAPRLYIARAKTLYDLDLLDDAGKELEKIIRPRWESTETWQLKALYQARKGNRSEAQLAFDKYKALSESKFLNECLNLQLIALLDGSSPALKKLKQLQSQVADDDAQNLLELAKITADLARLRGQLDDEAVAECKRVSLELLRKAHAVNPAEVESVINLPVFRSICEEPVFQNLIIKEDRYPFICLWHWDPKLESAKEVDVELSSVPKVLQDYANRQFYPAAISVYQCKNKNEQGAKGLLCKAAIAFHRLRSKGTEIQEQVRRKAAAASTMIALGNEQTIWPYLNAQTNPGMTAFVINQIQETRVDPTLLRSRIEHETNPAVRYSLIISLGNLLLHSDESDESRTGLYLDTLLKLFESESDPGVHAALDWTIRRMNGTDQLKALRKRLADGKVASRRNWYLTKTGADIDQAIELVVFPNPQPYLMGSPITEDSRDTSGNGLEEMQTRIEFSRGFAIGAKEITLEQFRQYDPRFTFDSRWDSLKNGPAFSLSWYDAASFCNWLSKSEGIPPDQWCYPARLDPSQKMLLPLITWNEKAIACQRKPSGNTPVAVEPSQHVSSVRSKPSSISMATWETMDSNRSVCCDRTRLDYSIRMAMCWNGARIARCLAVFSKIEPRLAYSHSIWTNDSGESLVAALISTGRVRSRRAIDLHREIVPSGITSDLIRSTCRTNDPTGKANAIKSVHSFLSGFC